MLKAGIKAPPFTLPDQTGTPHALADYKGSWVLLYFYPKDNTPGCTVEALTFRDLLEDFKKRNTIILGISVDSVKSHGKFCEKYGLDFTLLADEEKKVVEQYGVWQKKKFMGREYMGTMRTSFLIDPEGNIARIYEGVKPPVHAKEVLKDLETLTAA